MSTPEMGRPSKLQPEFVEKARKLCLLGATDEELADFFEVSVRTLYRWKLEDDEFCQALKAGKDHSDDRMERSLYQKGTGFVYVEQQAIKIKTGPHSEEVKVVDVERVAPPDTTAMIFWLKNRRAGDWRDKVDHSLSGSIDMAGESTTRSLAMAVLSLLRGSAHDEDQQGRPDTGAAGDERGTETAH